MTTKAEILKSIRAKCLDCSGGYASEITLCPVQACSLHPYRTGRDPNPARTGNIKNLSSVGEAREIAQ
ncbi:hypothetical protein [Ahrensia kielensis]|uniref:hypothetical protein n=1 Tax=Ahrensia kielensis TaxID=76980 RepID=UPI0012EA9FAE|nr:hypothetical protein [Ahrensia kielensis]